MGMQWARTAYRCEALAEAFILSTGTSIPAQQTCRRRWPMRAEFSYGLYSYGLAMADESRI